MLITSGIKKYKKGSNYFFSKLGGGDGVLCPIPNVTLKIKSPIPNMALYLIWP